MPRLYSEKDPKQKARRLARALVSDMIVYQPAKRQRALAAGTLKAELCNEKVRDLRTRIEELASEKRDLQARRERLELPAIDRDMLSALVDNFEQVMAEAPNPQKKELLRRLVKKVVVHDRRTIEVWYGLPNCRRIENWGKWLPKTDERRNTE